MSLKFLFALNDNSTSLFIFPNVHINIMGCISSKKTTDKQQNIFIDAEIRPESNYNIFIWNPATEDILANLKDMDQESECVKRIPYNMNLERQLAQRSSEQSTSMFSMSLSAAQNLYDSDWDIHTDYSNDTSYLRIGMTPEFSESRSYGSRLTPQTHRFPRGSQLYSRNVPNESLILLTE